MENYLIYDCEIIRLIKFDPQYPQLEFCQGWKDYKNMGISVIAFWHKGRLEHDINIKNRIPYSNFRRFLKALDSNPIIIGFNSKNFDDLLLKANGINIITKIDILEEIRKAAYGSKSWSKQPQNFSYSLQAIAKANGLSKNSKATFAPIQWQKGEYLDVINYCRNDVVITKAIFQKLVNGELIDPNNNNKLSLRN